MWRFPPRPLPCRPSRSRAVRRRSAPLLSRTGRGLALFAALAIALPCTAQAGQVVNSDGLRLNLGGDIKGFFDVFFPYEHLLMPEDPVPSAALDFRFKFEGSYKRAFSWQFHHSATASINAQDALSSGLMASTRGAQAREAINLSWALEQEGAFRLGGRIDRMMLGFHVPHLDLWLGRQPLSFGTGYFFTPLDLISPYQPQVVDREYKPGVDALRFDGFIGMSGHISAVVGVVDTFDREGLFAVGNGGFTLGLFDLGLLVAYQQSDLVVGISTQGSVGPVGVHADLAVTAPLPGEEEEESREEPFARIVVGADVRTDFGLTAMAELYGQTLGTRDPEDYLTVALSDRFTRGDLWTMGHLYLALTLSQEILPILSVSMFGVLNVLDPSVLLGPSLSWSVAQNADFVVGGFVSVGKRPEALTLTDLLNPDGTPLSAEEATAVIEPGSEFGLAGHQAYAQLKLYF